MADARRPSQVRELSLGERITSVDRLRSWTDQIPLHYEYTAGVAGEKFLRALRQGKILAAKCGKCGKRYLPPKTYCVDCFVEIKRFGAVTAAGRVAALAQSHVDFQGKKLKNPKAFAFVTFPGVTGGLVQVATGKGIDIGKKVTPRFKPATKRVGSLSDFEFVAV